MLIKLLKMSFGEILSYLTMVENLMIFKCPNFDEAWFPEI
jgi:hypothetical protein